MQVWNSLVWYGMVWYGMVWYGMGEPHIGFPFACTYWWPVVRERGICGTMPGIHGREGGRQQRNGFDPQVGGQLWD